MSRKFGTTTIIALAMTAVANASMLSYFAFDDCTDATYTVGDEYIQVGTPPGDQTAATNGKNGGFGWNRWQRGGWSFGSPPFGETRIKDIGAGFNMGPKQFGVNSASDGSGGADARRRCMNPLAQTDTLSFSMMFGGGGAGTEITSGEAGAEIRSGLLANPGRDMCLIIAEAGRNWRVYSDNGGTVESTLPVVPGQRMDCRIYSKGNDLYDVVFCVYGTGQTSTVSSMYSSTGQQVQTVQFYSFFANGDFFANNVGASNGGVKLEGNVTLDEWLPGPGGQSVTVELDGDSDQTANATLDANGNFVFDVTVPCGTYDVYVKGSHWLRKKVASKFVALAGVNSITVSLTNGDIDGDNGVTLLDYDIFSEYFDKTSGDSDWNTVGSNGFRPVDADLDGSNDVGLLDYDVFSNNYDKVGD